MDQPSTETGSLAEENKEYQVLALVERLKQKDSEAFAALYDLYAGRVYAILLRAVEPGLAEELLQDIFLALWQKAQLFDTGRGSFNAWFFTLVRHRLYDALPRYQKLRNESFLSSPKTGEQMAAMPDGQPGPEEAALNLFRNSEILEVLKTLPPDQREVILQTFFGGLTQRELAERLNVPLSTVKGRTRLALQRLRRLIRVKEFRRA